MIKISDYLCFFLGMFILTGIAFLAKIIVGSAKPFNVDHEFIQSGIFIVYLKLCLAANVRKS